jgi:hypothetical protein
MRDTHPGENAERHRQQTDEHRRRCDETKVSQINDAETQDHNTDRHDERRIGWRREMDRFHGGRRVVLKSIAPLTMVCAGCPVPAVDLVQRGILLIPQWTTTAHARRYGKVVDRRR